MAERAIIGQPAPFLSVSGWVQGEPVNLHQLSGQVILLEVFQVNCPGCFLYALPEAVDLHQLYSSNGLAVIGIATAFEDFDKNTLENLHLLAEKRQVIGETLRVLGEQNLLENGRLPYPIPFPLAMDRLNKRIAPISENEVREFIQEHFPGFDRLEATKKEQIKNQIQTYLNKLDYRAATFEQYRLKGTPSQILIDKRGLVREINFGVHSNLESHLLKLLNE